MDAASGPPPPGWYPDPSGTTTWRWWDGYQWTGHLFPPPAPPPYPSPPAGPQGWAHGTYVPHAVGAYPGTWQAAPRLPTAEERLATETQMAPWAKRAFFGMLVVAVLSAITVWPEGAWIRSVVGQVNAQLNNGATNVTVNRPAGLTIVVSVVLLLEIAIFVVLLNWQYAAAKTARMLELPAVHSAGLGVGSWFIPVVNLWFPYQAIRDCLPADDPARRVVVRMWLCYLGAAVAGSVAVGLSYARTPIAFAVAEVAVAFAIAVAVNGAAVVQAIGDAHREMLEPSRSDEVTVTASGPEESGLAPGPHLTGGVATT